MEQNTATFDLGSLNLEDLGAIVTPESSTPDIELEPIIDDLDTGVGEQPKREETTEEKVAEEKKQEPKVEQSNDTAKSILEALGITSYFVDGENGEDVEINIAESDIDLQTAVDLITNSYEQRFEDLKSKSISVEEVDTDRKEIIDFIIKGGDPKRLIEYQNEIAEVQQFDLEDEKDAEAVIRKYFSYKPDSSKEEVDAVVAGAKAQGNLLTLAESAANKITDLVEKRKEAEKEYIDNLVKEREDNIKKYKKEYKSVVKELGYTDKQYQKIVDFGTKEVKVKQPDGTETEAYEMDIVYSKLRSDPQQCADLALFMMDKNLYLKKQLEDKEIEMKKNLIKQVRLTKRSNSAETTRTTFEENNKKGTLALD